MTVDSGPTPLVALPGRAVHGPVEWSPPNEVGGSWVEPRVNLFEQIRRDWQREGTSKRELARRYGVHRQKVRQALADAVPPPRKT